MQCPTCEKSPFKGGIKKLAGRPEEETSPREGDLAVCGHCGEMLVFAEGLTPIKIPREVMRKVRAADVAVMYAAQAWARTWARRPVP